MKIPKKLKNAGLVSGLTAILLSSSCSDDDPISPSPTPNIPRVEKIIYSKEGGTVLSNGYEVVIPPNSISEDSAKVVLESPESELEIKIEGTKKLGHSAKVDFGSSLKDTVYVRFPVSFTDINGVVGVYTLDDTLKILKATDKGKVEVGYFADNPNPTFSIINLKKLIQPVRLDIPEDFDYSSNEESALLIHGMASDPSTFDKDNNPPTMLKFLNSLYNGRVITFQYPSGKSILENVNSLKEKLEENFGNSSFDIDVLGHSMGGIVGRTFVREFDKGNKVKKLITLGSPHNGVNLGVLERLLELDLNDENGLLVNPYSQGLSDLLEGSPFLSTINRNSDFINVNYLTFFGNKEGPLSPLIEGEDDGLIAASSANMRDPYFPQHENIKGLKSEGIYLSHTELIRNRLDLFERLRGSLLEGIPLDGLVAYYDFIGSANDKSGNWNHGTIYGATFTRDRFGNENSALSFDGINDYVELINESNFDLNEFTLYAIIKIPDYSKRNWFISKGLISGGNYSLFVREGDNQFWPGHVSYVHMAGESSNWSSLVSNSPTPLNEFVHVAVTINPDNEFKSYTNGELDRVVSTPVPPVLNNDNVLIGAGGINTILYFNGAIDDIIIYSRILNGEEVKALYNGGITK